MCSYPVCCFSFDSKWSRSSQRKSFGYACAELHQFANLAANGLWLKPNSFVFRAKKQLKSNNGHANEERWNKPSAAPRKMGVFTIPSNRSQFLSVLHNWFPCSTASGCRNGLEPPANPVRSSKGNAKLKSSLMVDCGKLCFYYTQIGQWPEMQAASDDAIKWWYIFANCLCALLASLIRVLAHSLAVAAGDSCSLSRTHIRIWTDIAKHRLIWCDNSRTHIHF